VDFDLNAHPGAMRYEGGLPRLDWEVVEAALEHDPSPPAGPRQLDGDDPEVIALSGARIGRAVGRAGAGRAIA
jgi:hypothetical protein